MVPTSNSRSHKTAAPRRARRRDARRDAILRAAALCFRSRGFADTGMREIADAADLSPANLYHYFRGKDEILYYCQDRALDRMTKAVAAARRTRASSVDRLQEILASHARTLLDDVDGATAHIETSALRPALRAKLVAKRDRYERALRDVIIRGVTTGELDAEQPAVITRAMLGALNWTATWFDPAGSHSAAELAQTIAAFLVRGVRAAERQPRRPSSRRS